MNMIEVFLMAKEMGLIDQNSQKSKLFVFPLKKFVNENFDFYISFYG